MRTLKNLAISLLSCLVLSSAVAQAQETSEETKTEKETKVETEAKATSAPTPKKKNTNIKKTNDTFIPSEEISEDLSVSFPVDI